MCNFKIGKINYSKQSHSLEQWMMIAKISLHCIPKKSSNLMMEIFHEKLQFIYKINK